MAIAARETRSAEAAIAMPRYKFTSDDYELIIANGIIAEDARVELIDGEIITMSSIGANHVKVVGLLNTLLARMTGSDVIVNAQSSIRLPNDNEPEPDIALIRADYDDTMLPRPGDVLLVIEVADSSLAYDREVKLPLYAAAGIPEAWLVDIPAGRIERHTEPSADGYGAIAIARRGATVTATTLPDVAVTVDALFG